MTPSNPTRCDTVRHDAYTCVTWRIHVYEYAGTIFLAPMVHWESVRGINDLSDDAFDSYSVWHWETWLIHDTEGLDSFMTLRDLTHSWHWETWLICMCDMTRSHVWHDSSANVALGINFWLIIYWTMPVMSTRHDITHSWHDFRDIIHSWHDSFLANDSFVKKNSLVALFIREKGFVHVCDMTHSCVWHDSLGI